MPNQSKQLPRSAGILLPVSSLPSPYGIGTLGEAAFSFIDFLKAAGQKYWQVLPVGPTSYGDSPYQSFSAFAGNPYFIDLDILKEEGLLEQTEIESFDWGDSPDDVDYAKLYNARFQILHTAFQRSRHQGTPDYLHFCKAQESWLEDYAFYMALKCSFDSHEWLLWPEKLRLRDSEELEIWSALLEDERDFWKFCQFKFFEQWNRVKDYAHQNGVQIIGDIPIYVALDSADVWAQPHLFQLDSKGFPTAVAGVPPDYFSEDGQLWGNPLYDWDAHKKEGYQWWIKRITHQLKQVDYLRIDHFRGFEAYCSIPYGETTARKGKWVKGPDADLFRSIRSALGDSLPIWAEDLGVITPEVEKLRDDFGFPGMKVLQFGFENEDDSSMLPHNFTTANCICYTGTHDNDTALGWYLSMDEGLQDRVRRYMNTDARMIYLDFIRTALSPAMQSIPFRMCWVTAATAA